MKLCDTNRAGQFMCRREDLEGVVDRLARDVDAAGDACVSLRAALAAAQAEAAHWKQACEGSIAQLTRVEREEQEVRAALTAARAEAAKLHEFKLYVHRRLEEAGVPADPPSPHREAGCRIGGRLDWVQSHAARLEGALRSVEWRELTGVTADEDEASPGRKCCPSCGRWQDFGHAPDCVLRAALAAGKGEP